MKRVSCILAVMAMAGSGSAWGQSACGDLKNAYGPFDYRTGKAQLEIVERSHFTPEVEQLKRGNTATIGGDLDYTLRASPNHHRALNSMVRLALRNGQPKPLGPSSYTVDCYFDRALRFANDDGIVRVIYGVYLYHVGKKKDAARVLEDARKFERDNPNLEYNLGLVYFDLKDMPRALESAQKAYALGAQFPALRNKLKAAGVWKDAAGGASAPEAAPAQTAGNPTGAK